MFSDALLNSLESILLVLVPSLKIRICFLEILERHWPTGVVGSKNRTLEPLAKNLGAHAQTLGIKGGGEELALDL